MDALKGKKTYIIAVLIGAATVAKSLGYIDEATFQMIVALLGGGGLATLSAKMNRTELIAKDNQQMLNYKKQFEMATAAQTVKDANYGRSPVGQVGGSLIKK